MTFTQAYLSELKNALEQIDLDAVDRAIGLFREARDGGRQIFVCGNGGSASTASHFTCDILKGASYGREKRFRIQVLSDQLPTILAYANDVSYDCVFAEQLRNFAQPGDLFMALSGSGNSENVVQAMQVASETGCRTIAMTGRDGGRLASMAELNIHVAVPHMGRIEDAHMIACHMICYYFMDNAQA